jgi:DNA-binding transcriptional LysR family regulator
MPNPIMRLKHIEIFHAIMRAGTLSKAAEHLCISQPAMSKALAQAERGFGLSLFLRINGRLQPTHEAELLFAESQKIQASFDNIRHLVRNLTLQPHGYLRIGCLPSLGLSLIPKVVQQFRRVYPDVSIRIQTRHTAELLNALFFTHELDIGVALNPPEYPGITAVELGRTPLVSVGPPNAGKDGQPISLQALVAGDWISLGNVDPLGELVCEQLQIHGLDDHVATIEAQTWYVARALAARGVGCALLDELTARSGADDVTIRPIAPELSIGIFALSRDGGLDSRFAHAFVETLRESIECSNRTNRHVSPPKVSPARP